MSVKTNDSSVQVTGSLWTGLANMTIIAINPTKDQLIALGRNPQKEPEYLSSDTTTGKAKFRIDFFVKEETGKFQNKVTFFMEDRPAMNKEATKSQYTNSVGQFSWPKGTETTPNYAWFKMDGLRPAFVGEQVLMDFIRAYANVDIKDACTLDTIANIVKGDLTEINNLWKSIPTNKVKTLNGVKDGKYQDTYTKYFGRPYQNNFEAWKKALAAEYGEFKADFQGDFTLKPYTGSSIVTTDTPTNLGSSGTANAAPAYNF